MDMKRPRTRWLALLLAGLALGASACGGGGESVADAEQNLCGSLSDLATAITGLADLSIDSTKEEIQGALGDVQDAVDEVKSDAADVTDADTAALTSAQENLQSVVDDRPDASSYVEAFPKVRPALDEVRTTFQDIQNGLQCQ